MSDAGVTVLEHEKGRVAVRECAHGKRQIFISLEDTSQFVPRNGLVTSYPVELIRSILEVKGPAYICDEIARDEDPSYTEGTLLPDILAYVSEEQLAGKRIVDFGCGSGASTSILGRRFPGTEILGVELEERLLQIARKRAEHYGLENVSFLKSPAPDRLHDQAYGVDYIVLSAVYEHLLPNERGALLPLMWSALKPGGVLFLDQTPHRWFPIEPHSTYLPLINYLPDRAAHLYASRFSRVQKPEPWPAMLRNGIRGGTAREILRYIEASGGRAELLRPCRMGIRDRIELWFAGTTFHSYPRGRKLVKTGAKMLKAVTGIELVPYLSLAIRKDS